MSRFFPLCTVFALSAGFAFHLTSTAHATPKKSDPQFDSSKSSASTDAFAWSAQDTQWVLLSVNAPLHTAPDIQSDRVQLRLDKPWDGQVMHRYSGYAMRTVGESGAWYAVETGWPNVPLDHCLRGFTGLDTFTLRLYVPKTAVFFVLNTPHSIDNFDGLRRVTLPGEIVSREGGDWSLANGISGYPGSIPETHVGRTFSPHHFTSNSVTAAILCDNGDLHRSENLSFIEGCDNWENTYGVNNGASGRLARATLERGCSRYEKQVKRDRRKVRLTQAVGPSLLSLIDDGSLSSASINDGAIVGFGGPGAPIGKIADGSTVKAPVKRWPVRLKAGTALFFADGKPAGNARVEYTRTTMVPPTDGKTCFDHRIGCAWDGGEAPKHCAGSTSRDTLRLCYATP